MHKLIQFVGSIADSVLLLLMIVGIVVALLKFRSLGRAAFFAAAGFLMLAIGFTINIGYFAWVTYGLSPGGSRELFETTYAAQSAARFLLSLIGFVLLILAIVSKRPVPTTNPVR